MRTLKPLCLTAAVALALAGGSAIAQTTGARVGAAGTTTSTTTGTRSSTGTTGTTSSTGTTSTTGTAVGGCSGTNGSTCTASDTNPGSTTTGGVTTSQTSPPVSATAPANTSTTTTTTTSGGSAMGTNQTTVDAAATRPGPFDAGGNFGPQAVPPTNATGGVENGVVLPTTGAAGTGSQQNVFVQPQQPSSVTTNSTPIFDQAAREGRARDARRRAAGQEPRVIGIAPRTDRDLTWQMPDDPIIRY